MQKLISGLVCGLILIAGIQTVQAQKATATKAIEVIGKVTATTNAEGVVTKATLVNIEGKSCNIVLDEQGLKLVKDGNDKTVRVAGLLSKENDVLNLAVKEFSVVVKKEAAPVK